MRRCFVVALVVVACGGQTAPDLSIPQRDPTTMPPVTQTSASVPQRHQPTPTTAVTTPSVPSFVVWMREGLPAEFEEIAVGLDGIEAVSIGRSGTLHIVETHTAGGFLVDQPPAGFVIPAEGLGLKSDTFTEFVDPATAAVLDAMGPDEVALGATSAAIRQIGVGGTITLEGGITKTVAAVFEDEAVGYAEVVSVTEEPFVIGGSERRWALVIYDGPATALEEALVTALPGNPTVRVRMRGTTDSRRPRTVRPQVFIKETFGEFAYRPGSGGRVTIDPEWRSQNIVTRSIPLLGRATCHREFIALLDTVMQGLSDDGLGSVIDRTRFRGCWTARYISGSTRLSRHTWGVAADINFGGSLNGGSGSPVNEELVERMAAVGITSGHLWTTPDPGHFEFYGLPETLEPTIFDAL